jgi:hypothetical protein
VYVAQFGVPELAKLGLSDRFEQLRAKLDIELKGFPVLKVLGNMPMLSS